MGSGSICESVNTMMLPPGVELGAPMLAVPISVLVASVFEPTEIALMCREPDRQSAAARN